MRPDKLLSTLSRRRLQLAELLYIYTFTDLLKRKKFPLPPFPLPLLPLLLSSLPPLLPGQKCTNKKPEIMKSLGVLLILISSSCSLLKVLAVLVWEDACTDNEIHPPIPEIYQCMYQAFFFSRESLASQRDHFSYPRGLRYSEWG